MFVTNVSCGYAVYHIAKVAAEH